jgi:hypothetical protein
MGEPSTFEFVTADEAAGRVTPLVALTDRRLHTSVPARDGCGAEERQAIV